MAFREIDVIFAAMDVYGAIDEMDVIACRMGDILARFDICDMPIVSFAMQWLIANGHVSAEYYEDDGLTFILT